MIRISQIALPAEHKKEELTRRAAKLLRVPETEIKKLTVVRRSVDARKKEQLLFSYIADVSLADKSREAAIVKKAKNVNIQLESEQLYRPPSRGGTPLKRRPVIIGAGPAGLFAALLLAENGYRPLILEQGGDVGERQKKVEEFWKNGPEFLDPSSNVQFGEGGAGTFSDGKLNTLVKDVSGRNRAVLLAFAEAGADSSILFDSKPHIGTDVLRAVVKNLRTRILDAGGEVRFHAKVTDFAAEGGKIASVTVNGTEVIRTETVILCAGHSARDLFFLLEKKKILMEPKPFAVGLRVQHPQRQINRSQYGVEQHPILGAAPYKVTAKTRSGRGVYSFCMCPGGFVVNASSETGRLAVNGMSNWKRDGENANSAVIVAVTPEDFPGTGPLGGVEFQRKLEEAAFQAGGGKIPVQLFGDFKEGRVSASFGEVAPAFCGGYAFADLRKVLPEPLILPFLEGMEQFGRKMKGFDRPDAILAGVESRTSSPVRIVRSEGFESSLLGLFPCGEGAGYAGGITSAAMDGMKVAEEIIRRYRPDFE